MIKKETIITIYIHLKQIKHIRKTVKHDIKKEINFFFFLEKKKGNKIENERNSTSVQSGVCHKKGAHASFYQRTYI